MKDENRHRQFLDRIKHNEPGVLFLGDSITDQWPSEGSETWSNLAHYNPANLGVSGDRTEHLLWRVTHGELENIHPKVVVILIGTNNIGNFEDERPEWIADGIGRIVATVRERLPNAKVLLLGIFPRDGKDSAQRKATRDVNNLIRALDDGDQIRFLDIGQRFLDPEGNIPFDIMPDQLHLSARGYAIWYENILPFLTETLSDKTDGGETKPARP